MEENLDGVIQLLEHSIDHSSIQDDVLIRFRDLAQQMKREREETIHEITNKTNHVDNLHSKIQTVVTDIKSEKTEFRRDMNHLLNKVEHENIKLVNQQSNFKTDIKSFVQQARKKFKQKLEKDHRGIENSIKEVDKLYEERRVSICAEVETYSEQQRSIIDQLVTDRKIDLENYKIGALDQCAMIEERIEELKAE